ncbi:PIN domain-containing protein [Variovorax saccharolyticus]|uniref:PIN domain-containing protein n=1 Tax=Variovorax saccharolyticus TaxID=3053516 RepID=UPI004037930E
MYLLDTNVISELRRPRPHGAVLAWLQSVPDSDLHVSAVSLGEIQGGSRSPVSRTRPRRRRSSSGPMQWLRRTTRCRWMPRLSACGHA